jgi:creatinine amidohydrolase/Fe(II)-dependent formamide hydrolase-like protein
LRKLYEAGLWCVQVAWWEIVADLVKQTFAPPYFHADDMETSVAWALGQRVLQDKLVDEAGREPIPGYTKVTMFAEPPNFSPVADMTDYTKSGTIGNAKQADPAKGKRVAEAAVDRIAAFLERVAGLGKGTDAAKQRRGS